MFRINHGLPPDLFINQERLYEQSKEVYCDCFCVLHESRFFSTICSYHVAWQIPLILFIIFHCLEDLQRLGCLYSMRNSRKECDDHVIPRTVTQAYLLFRIHLSRLPQKGLSKLTCFFVIDTFLCFYLHFSA